MIAHPGIAAIILAGGRSRRMGGDDKAWLPWQCSTLIETVAAALRPQVDELLVVANRYPERYAGIGLRCVSDRRADYPGPMAGLEAGLYASDARWVLSVPVDAPHLPADLVNRMLAGAEAGGSARACDADGVQPLIAVYRRDLALPLLVRALDSGERAMHRWQAGVSIAEVDFAPHRFGNLNTPDDLREEACNEQ